MLYNFVNLFANIRYINLIYNIHSHAIGIIELIA